MVGTLKMNGTARTGAFSADGTQLMTSGGDGTGAAWAGQGPSTPPSPLDECNMNVLRRSPGHGGAEHTPMPTPCCCLPCQLQARHVLLSYPPVQCMCGTCARSAACIGTRTRAACRGPAWRARQMAPSLPRVGAGAARMPGGSLPAVQAAPTSAITLQVALCA